MYEHGCADKLHFNFKRRKVQPDVKNNKGKMSWMHKRDILTI